MAPVAEASDAALLAEYAANASEDAFAELVRRHWAMVHGVCRRVLGDASAADDAAQAVFIALARKAERLTVDGSLGAWLHTAAVAAARQTRRGSTRRIRHERRAAEGRPVASETPPPGDELWSRLDRALAALPAEQRAAIVLRYVEELSEEEAARALGCPPRTLHNRVQLGLEKLRARLADRGRELTTAGVAALLVVPPSLPPAGFTAAAAAAAPATPTVLAAAGSPGALALTVKLATAALLMVCAVAGGVGVVRQARDAPAIPVAPAFPAMLLRGHTGPVSHVAVLADGTVLSSGWDRTVIASAPDGAVKWTLSVPREGAYGCAVSDDETLLATGGHDGVIDVWDLRARTLLHSLPAHQGSVITLAFARDGRMASGGRDGGVAIWDARSGTRIRECAGSVEGGSAWAVAFSPDGQALACASDDGCVRIWRGTAERPQVLRGHSSSLRGLAWSPDGARLASSGGDGAVRLWNARDGVCVATLPTSDSMVMAVAYSHDGRLLASADVHGRVLLRAAGDGAPRSERQAGSSIATLAFSADDGALSAGGPDDNEVRLWSLAGIAPR